MKNQMTLFDRESDYLEAEIANLDKKSTSFRVHASLIYKLGESLIADEVTALSELIKNAYDADATVCVLSIDSEYQEDIDGVTCHGIIEIYDNGCGMDLSTIINGWLTLSNSPKKKMKKEKRTTPKFHRYPLGDKGLGRLSVQKLGRSMRMITKSEKSNIEYTVLIPWGDFLKNTTIDQIPVQILERRVAHDKSYTKIVIQDLIEKDRWADKSQVNILSNHISKIVSPFRSDQNSFKVVAKINGDEIETIESVFKELLESSCAKHIIKYSNGKAKIFSEYKNTFFYNRDILQRVSSGEFTLTETAVKDFLQVNQKSLKNVVPNFKKGMVIKALDECLFNDIYIEKNPPNASELVEDIKIENNIIRDDFSFEDEKESNLSNGNPGDFECEIYEYTLDPKYLDYLYENLSYENLIDREEYRDFITRFHGIKVVRDGFVVQGFGEGNGGDWLGLTTSSKTTGSFFDLRNDSVIGCVYLTGSKNAVLKETTNREGFVDDEYYQNFKKILTDSISRVNRNRKKLNDAMKKYVVESIAFSGTVSENALSFRPTIEQIRKDIADTTSLVHKGKTQMDVALKNYNIAKTAIISTPFVQQETIESVEELYKSIEAVSSDYNCLLAERDSLNNKLDTISLDFEKMNERLQDLFELAGLGISVELFTHEFDSAIKNVKQKNQQVIDSRLNATVDSLIKHIKYITFSLDALRKQMSYFNPGLKYVRAEKQIFKIREFVENHKSFYKERCEKKQIIFKIKIIKDFEVKINRGMLNQVFDNLFSNSEYWLDFSMRNGLIEIKKYTIEIEERGIITIWDNGIGISRDIETRLFEPFESKKQGGRGLGLYIAANNLKYNSSRIRLLNERNENGNLFKFEIDLSQVVQ